MQPNEPIALNIDYEALETHTLALAELAAQSAEYARMRPSLLDALGVTDADLREWESHSTLPPRIETVASPDDEDGDFEVMPLRGETEFILDDPDAEDEEDEDAEKPEGEESEDDEDEADEDEADEDDDIDDEAPEEDEEVPGEDEDEGGFDSDDVILEDDDGEKD